MNAGLSFHAPIPSTLIDLLRYRASQQPELCGFTFLTDGEVEEQRISYGDLDRQARAIGAELQRRGATGDRALLLYRPGLDYIAAFFGCLYAGVIAVPLYPPNLVRPKRSLPRLLSIMSSAQPSFVLATAAIAEHMQPLSAETVELAELQWLATDQIAPGAEDNWQPPTVSASTLAFLQYTSGSTAAPKGVMLTHANLLHNLALIYHAFGHSATSRGVIWLPPYHDMGLIGGILQPLYGGFPVTLMAPVDFLQRPVRWLQAISRYRATTSGGPNFAFDLCVRKITTEQRATLDLSSWQVAFNGAEPIRAETIERFVEMFAPCGFRREAFYPTYGLAEATLIVTGGPMMSAPVIGAFQKVALEQNRVCEATAPQQPTHTLVGSGLPLADQQVAIVHPETRAQCDPGSIGEIWVAGSSIAQGYWGQPEATRQAFQARRVDAGSPQFLRTGDLGFLHAGQLFITGRLHDLIIVRGRNHYPQDIELTVERSHAALRADASIAFSVEVEREERLVVVAEIERQHRFMDHEIVVQAIREAVVEQHELPVYAVVLVKPGSIPKTSSGKLQRHLARTQFIEGSLAVIARHVIGDTTDAPAQPANDPPALSRAELEALPAEQRQHALARTIQAELARQLRLPAAAIALEQPLDSLGLDSLMLVELQHLLEHSLGVDVPLALLLDESGTLKLAGALLARLSDAAPHTDAPLPPTASQQLSYGQRALWFLHQLEPESAAYTIARALQIDGPLDRAALQAAFQILVDRHPALRASFNLTPAGPIQTIAPALPLVIHDVDATTWSVAMLHEQLTQAARQPFDLAEGPLLRVWLYARTAQEYVLLLAVHHIVADLWSLVVLLDELRTIYPLLRAAQPDAARSLPALDVIYADFVRWQTQRLSGVEGERLWAYWQRQLGPEGAPASALLALPTDHPRPPTRTNHGASENFSLDPALAKQLNALAKQQGVTLYVVLLAAFATLLQRYSGQDDLVIGSPFVGRPQADMADVVGYFVSPLPLRVRFEGAPTFAELLRQVRQTVLDALAHQDYPFALLVERLQPARSAAIAPLFQTLFVLAQPQRSAVRESAGFVVGQPASRLVIDNLDLRAVPLDLGTAQLDLSLTMAEAAGTIGGVFEYNADLFDATTIRRLVAHLTTLLSGIVATPSERIAQMPLLSTIERQHLLDDWNTTAAAYPHDRCVHQLFEAQAARTPAAVAVIAGAEQMTYAELNTRSSQLAHELRQHGIQPGALVGLYLDRSCHLLVGLLGILKAGAAYIPLDPLYPPARLSLMLADAALALLVTEERLAAALPPSTTPTLCLDSAWTTIAHHPTDPPAPAISADDLAYVIYTSGSTGQPKGVMISHRSLCNCLWSMRERPGLRADDTVLAVTTISFDIAALELLLPLIGGARVVIASREVAADGQLLMQQIAQQHVTVLQATPATWHLLLQADWPGRPDLRAWSGGEALPQELADQLRERVAELWNVYGPTETTIWSAARLIDQDHPRVAMSGPINNTQLYLLDSALEPVPLGVVGELYIGGDGLARGYLNRPDLTAERFVPDPFRGQPGARLYRSGDLGRPRPDGTLEFLGRSDNQIKLRGFRIELGDIEAALRQHPQVQQAAIVVEGEDLSPRLVAYVVTGELSAENREPSVSPLGSRFLILGSLPGLRAFLQTRLPAYMLPSAFVQIDALPLTPNGKLDRRALSISAGQVLGQTATFVAPRTPSEAWLAQMWAALLHLERVGVHDNFFDLGGHSLLATQCVSHIQAELGLQLPLQHIFERPTVALLAEHIDLLQWSARSVSASAPPTDTPDREEWSL